MMFPRLEDIYKDGVSGDGIFTDLQTLDVPWQSETISTTLDIAYHSNHGERIISPLVKKLLNTSGELTSANRAKIASIIFTLFNENWTKLYNTLSLEYNPINNYDMSESETYQGANGYTKTNTGTMTDATGNTVTGGVFGFNSSTESVPADENVSDGLNTHTNNLTETDSGNNSFVRTLERSGNIGVTTSQQMIESERDLWKWNFYESVFNDIDSVLTLKIY